MKIDWKQIALMHAEKIGVYEFEVNGCVMEWYSLYEDGMYHVWYDLSNNAETRKREYPPEGPFPDKLYGRVYHDAMGRKHRATKYNYGIG